MGGVTVKACREKYRLMAIKFGWNSTSKPGEGSSPVKKAAGNGVNKRTGRVGAAAKKGKGKKAAADNEDVDSNNGDENNGGDAAMEDDSSGEV